MSTQPTPYQPQTQTVDLSGLNDLPISAIQRVAEVFGFRLVVHALVHQSGEPQPPTSIPSLIICEKVYGGRAKGGGGQATKCNHPAIWRVTREGKPFSYYCGRKGHLPNANVKDLLSEVMPCDRINPLNQDAVDAFRLKQKPTD